MPANRLVVLLFKWGAIRATERDRLVPEGALRPGDELLDGTIQLVDQGLNEAIR
jgi:hypothetical protein